MRASARDGYHHGDLKVALVTAAEDVIREDGVEGFSLRKAAARAGVTPGASAHHFNGVKALLTEVAIRAFSEMKAALAAVPPTGHAALDLRAQATGYVAYAVAHPGLFRLLCRVDLVDYRDARLAEASFDALFNFGTAAAAYFVVAPPMPDRRALHPHVIGAFATAHGLAHMTLEGRPSLVFDGPDPTAAFMQQLLPTILSAAWPEQKTTL